MLLSILLVWRKPNRRTAARARLLPDAASVTSPSRWRAPAVWLKEQGATVVTAIEDPQEGHGALHRSARHARTVLDSFLTAKP